MVLLWVYTHNKGRYIKIKIYKNMPRLDGTGPYGYGPMSGRGMGPCGRGMGHGRGFGRRSFGYNWRMNSKEESEVLKDEAEILEEDLKAIKERLTQIKGKK